MYIHVQMYIISKIKVLQIENDNIELFFNRKNNIMFEDSIFVFELDD